MYYVPNGAHDWDDTSAVNANITAIDNHFIVPNEHIVAYADVDTSGIPDTDDISAATLTYEISSTSKTKTWLTPYIATYIWDGSAWELIDSYTDPAAGTRNISLTAGQITHINKTGDTKFRYVAGEADATKYIIVNIKAYETAQANATRLSITHAPPSTFSGEVISIINS
jgi:hypothetical protein